MYRLGRNRGIPDPRTLQLAKYLTAELGPPPAEIDYAPKVRGDWPMYGNNVYGDCTCAAAGHMIEVWTANASRRIVVANSDIVDAYLQLSPGDDGCTLQQVLDYWRKTGFGGHQIMAYAQVDVSNMEQVRQALDLFGSVYIALELPDFAVMEGEDWLKIPWNLPTKSSGGTAPDDNNGHCVPLVGYDKHGFSTVTWGAGKSMNDAFFNAYCVEAYAAISPDWLNAQGQAPPGLNLSALQADLAQL